jgi:hypothetical protein
VGNTEENTVESTEGKTERFFHKKWPYPVV